MAVIDSIVEGVIELIFHLIFEVIFFYTGECILYILTFGIKKPRWDYYANEKPARWAVLTEFSWWVGFLFWVFTIGWVARKLWN